MPNRTALVLPSRSPATTGPEPGTRRRVLVATAVGTTVEFYDFFVFGTASALVFATVFFPGLGPAGGLAASLATFATGFVARPVGAVVFGLIGDRWGRRRVLVSTLVLMGVATAGIGLLPDARSWGAAAPLLLVGLRLLQGLAVGGEWAGAALLAAEFAGPHRRGRDGVYPQLGQGLGFALSSSTFLLIGALMSPGDFLAGGWRIPFLLSAGLVGLGLVVRLHVSESPVFHSAPVGARPTTSSLRELLTHDRRTMVLAAFAFAPTVALGYLGTVALPSHVTSLRPSAGPVVLTAGVGAGAALVIATLVAGHLADRWGRRAPVAAAAALAVVVPGPALLLAGIETPAAVTGAMVLVLTASAAGLAPMASYLPELFRTRRRTSGAGIVFNLAAALGGMLAPLAAIVGTRGPLAGGITLTTAYAVCGLVGLVALRGLPETRGRDLGDDVGDEAPQRRAAS